MRIIIDTNIWISYFLFNSFSGFEKILSDESIIIIACNELINEIRRVFKYPKFKKIVSQKNIKSIIELITDRSIFINPIKQNIKSRDIKDNYLIDLAVTSHTQYLITGDNDLLSLKKINKTKIFTLKQLLNILSRK